MYPNFRAERARKGVTLETLADQMGVTAPTLSNKLNGKQPLLFSEAKILKQLVETDLPLEVLFEEAV